MHTIICLMDIVQCSFFLCLKFQFQILVQHSLCSLFLWVLNDLYLKIIFICICILLLLVYIIWWMQEYDSVENKFGSQRKWVILLGEKLSMVSGWILLIHFSLTFSSFGNSKVSGTRSLCNWNVIKLSKWS